MKQSAINKCPESIYPNILYCLKVIAIEAFPSVFTCVLFVKLSLDDDSCIDFCSHTSDAIHSMSTQSVPLVHEICLLLKHVTKQLSDDINSKMKIFQHALWFKLLSIFIVT